MNTLAALLHDDYRRFASRPCVGVKTQGRYVTKTYAELERHVGGVAAQLLEKGIGHGDRIAIVSRTRLEWLAADQGIATIGAVVVPVYPTLPSSSIAHLISDSGAKIAIVEGAEEAKRVREAAPSIGLLAIDAVPGLERLAGAGPALDEPRIAAAQAKVMPGSIVSFLYTSGTTGKPKGVLYDHQRATGALHGLGEVLGLRVNDVALSFLPMSHALGRGSAIAYFHNGVVNYFGESIDTVAEDFRLARPTIAFTVPRVFEKAYERITAMVQAGSPFRKKLFDAAFAEARAVHATGKRRVKARVLDRIVFGKIRGRLGGRVRALFSGGASLAPHIAEFFHLAGVPIRDVYGMSEFGLSHATPEGAVKFGSCGKANPGYECRIAEDGEILVRCHHGMVGYNELPDETAAFRENDGWMHSGDVGHIDSEGWLFITDRKKALIVLSNGKKVAPTPIESRLCGQSPLIAQVVVLGEGKSFLTALIAPNRELAQMEGLDDAEITRRVQSAVDAVNKELPSFETVKRFELLEKPLTEADGDLTPTLKVKRPEVMKKNAQRIANLYAER